MAEIDALTELPNRMLTLGEQDVNDQDVNEQDVNDQDVHSPDVNG